MATKVKPSRLQVSWTPQVWQVPVYVNEDTFQWWAGGGWWGWDVMWPASSTDWDIVLFDWATGKVIKDSWKTVSWLESSISANTTAIGTINWKIPSAATSSNQLADKAYVNDSINSVTAYYITKNAQGDQWASYAELAAATTFYSGWAVRVPTRNDYTVVLDDETHSNATTRYSYQGNWWEYQYTVHETALTQAQLDALNSWITAAKVSAYDAIPVITDNCQLANWCGYTTCTWTVSTCADVVSALGYTPYSTGNPCNYINNFAGVVSALWYTPYNTTNPNWYTTCTWTLTQSAISDTAFWAPWSWDTTHAPSKNAMYDVLWNVEALLAAL